MHVVIPEKGKFIGVPPGPVTSMTEHSLVQTKNPLQMHLNIFAIIECSYQYTDTRKQALPPHKSYRYRLTLSPTVEVFVDGCYQL